MFQQAQEIGEETGTGQALGFERVFEVLDQILALAALTVGVVEQAGLKFVKIAYHQARIGALGGVFGFDHHPMGAFPSLGAIADGGELAHFYMARGEAVGGGFQERLRQT
jgi:hypothetical protein